MSAKFFICSNCKEEVLCFSDEEHRLPEGSKCRHSFSPLPNQPVVVHSTVRFMHESLLDCWHDRRRISAELDREAAYEKQTKQYLKHIINS